MDDSIKEKEAQERRELLQSMDIAADKRAQLKQLFPEVFTYIKNELPDKAKSGLEMCNAPSFRIFAGHSEIGAAWQRQTGGDHPKPFLSVRLDDPCLSEPLMAALFESTDGSEAQLVWKRQ